MFTLFQSRECVQGGKSVQVEMALFDTAGTDSLLAAGTAMLPRNQRWEAGEGNRSWVSDS